MARVYEQMYDNMKNKKKRKSNSDIWGTTDYE